MSKDNSGQTGLRVNAPYSNKALPSGAVLREWRLEDVLGVGGFGIVYRGRGTYFGELVAIKEYFPSAISDRIDGETVKPSDSSSEEIYELGLKKFLEEAKILWQLSHPERHPNIVSVRSLFEIHGTAYMVMDFESGVSLSQMLREGRRFDEASLMALLRPIIEGLERAHRAGVIHRDIKPPNILVDDTGRPVLIDFGSARFDSGQATSTKVTFYTPPYAALEQYVKTYAQGPWTDIYSLGVVAYQCVTGEKPPEVLERLHGGANEALSTREWPGYSPAFIRAIDAAMATRPQERPQSLSEWLKLLDGAEPPIAAADDDVTRVRVRTEPPAPAAGPAPTPPPSLRAPTAPESRTPAAAASPRRPLDKRVLAGAGALVLAAGIGGVLLLPKHPPAPGVPTASAPQLAITQAGPAAPPLAAAGDVRQIAAAASALVAEARQANRPSAELSALSGAAAKINALTAQGPAQAARATEVAKAMASAEAAALDRSARGEAREVDRVLASSKGGSAEASRALSAVRRAKTKLGASVAAASRAADGPAALQAARDALGAYSEFNSAYTDAKGYFVPARRAEFTALKGQIEGLADRVSAFADKKRPSLFAAGSRKAAYQKLKDNDVQAKAQRAQLAQLSKTVADATDVAAVDDALRQATAIRQTLGALYDSSNAAAAAAQ